MSDALIAYPRSAVKLVIVRTFLVPRASPGQPPPLRSARVAKQ